MDSDSDMYLRIRGGRRLSGAVTIGGAKNAALPCLAATLLTDQPSRLRRVPDISDVRRFCDILQALGAEVEFDSERGEVEVRPPPGGCAATPPDQLVASLRASFLVMGPLLARSGRAACGAPGGDLIGARPLDVHLAGFRAFGAQVETDGGRTTAYTPGGLRSARIVLDYPSVLGTENLLLAAVLARGRTEIVNAAMEPEIVCLADMLIRMGAQVGGAGQHTIAVDGVDRLGGCEHELIPDRIEIGTLAIAAAITGGDIRLRRIEPRHFDALSAKLEQIGVELDCDADELRVSAPQPLKAANVQALPYPGFATDLQAPITALLTQAHGTSKVHERVFENRMHHLDQLRRFGADLVDEGAMPVVHGPVRLSGAVVRGTDIRAAAALVVAALAADGESRVYGVDHLDRAYAALDRTLSRLGAQVDRVH